MIHYVSTDGLSSPWIALELSVLERDSIPFTLHAMRKAARTPDGGAWIDALHARTRPIYPLGTGIAVSVVKAFFQTPGRFVAALGNALFGKRENLRARVGCFAHFFVGCHWAMQLRRGAVSHIHSQWVHASASIGMYAAWILDVPFSFTGHGADMWRDRVALEDKIRRAAFICCISRFHRRYYLEHGARESQLIDVYCGIDRSRFVAKTQGTPLGAPQLRIRSHSRIVEKKGYSYLIDACRLLIDRGVDVECVIAGTGPLVEELQAQSRERDVADAVNVLGKRVADADLVDFLHEGNAYCLPCVWSSDDDADGLPASLIEAMASGLPSVSTDLVGIPDLIEHEVSGLLVAPNDATALADALQRLVDERGLATRLAEGGYDKVATRFDINTCVDGLIAKYREALERDA